MAGCIIGGAAGIAGFVETPGSTLTVQPNGSARSFRTYQGPTANKTSFLNSFPAGSNDPEYSTLTRTNFVNVTDQAGWTFVTLEFGGVIEETAGIRPFRVTKEMAERSVSLNLTTGITNEPEGVYSLKYTTLVHSVEWTNASDPGEASKQSDAGLPGSANDAILFNLVDPPFVIGATNYLGGGLNAPSGKTPLMTSGTDYAVNFQPVDFRRFKDRGDYWQISESWAAIATPPP